MTATDSPAHDIVGLFPGQGAQALGMGMAWVDREPEARALLERAEAVSGLPLGRLIRRGPMRDLMRTDVLQPALCTVSAIMFASARRRGIRLAAAAGHSLGELSAFHAAGAMDFDTLIRLAARRGRAMQAAAEAQPGGMTAVICDPAVLKRWLETAPLGGVVVANRNAAGQIVLSGPPGDLETVAESARAAGLRTAALKVAGPWHSPAMAPARESFATALAEAEIGDPAVPVWSAVDGRPVRKGPDVRDRLAAQIDRPVRWADVMDALLAEYPEASMIEIGPGKVLTGLVLESHGDVGVFRCDTPRALDRLIRTVIAA